MKTRLARLPIPRLTVRRLVAFWTCSTFLAWTILVVGWLVARRELVELGERVLLDVKSLDMTRELELAIVTERREDLLWQTTGASHHRERRDVYQVVTEQIAASLDEFMAAPQEQEHLGQIRARLRALREQSASSTAAPAEAATESANDLLALVNRLHVRKKSQMEASVQAAGRMYDLLSHWTLGLAAATAVLVLAGSLSIIHRVVRPTLALTDAAGVFGRGDFSARAPVLSDDELGALARTFNNMAGDIADRERDRLQFVAMVVHDLKNPVLAMQMAARLLRRSAGNEQESRPYLDAIDVEAKRLRAIVHDLMDDVQVASGRFSVQKAAVNLCALVRRLIQAEGATFADHRIVVETPETCIVSGDARRLERVVMNLVSNAVKYSPPGTSVTVRVEKKGPFALLTVSDQGPGIRAEDLQVIFQPFGRGRSAGTSADGAGLGLYVVKQIVEAHGGRIEVESRPGQGATFRISLPLA